MIKILSAINNIQEVVDRIFNDQKQLKKLIFFSVIARLVLFLADGHDMDFMHFQYWSESMVRYGFYNVYTYAIAGFTCDYPPLYHYILWPAGELFVWLGIPIHSDLFKAFLKLMSLLIEASFLFYFYKETKNKLFLFLMLLSPVTIVNAYGWGQVDLILGILLFSSIYYLLENKLLKAALFLALCLCFKSQTLLFMPIIGLLFLLNSSGIMEKIKSLALFILVVFIVNAPFIFLSNNPINSFEPHISAAGRYNNISVNAFNIYWGLFADYSLKLMDKFPPNDVLVFGLVSRKTIAYSIFSVIYASILVCMILMRKDKAKIYSLITFFCFSFFMFLPEMHERYLFPFFIFSTFLVSYKKNEIWYLLVITILHVINLFWGWGGQHHLTSLFFFNCSKAVAFATFIAWCFYARETYLRLFNPNTDPIEN
jgi:Gpi18-like mannosyltransferase